MKKKRAIIIIVIVAAIIAAVASFFFFFKDDKVEEETLDVKIQTKTTAYRTDLEESADTLKSKDAIVSYLSNWAKAKNIDHKTDDAGNVIMSIPADSKYKDAEPTVIVCNYDSKNFINNIDTLASALYIAKNHEPTGKLTVIFTDNEGNGQAGIQKLSASYFSGKPSVFVLESGVKNMWATSSAAMHTYKFTGKLEYTEPQGSKAYKLTISGLPGGNPDSKINSYPNPIKKLSDELAYFKTNAMIFELADMQGGSSPSLYPQSATMTLVLDDNYAEKFKTKMDKSIANYNEKRQKDYPDIKYSIEEVEMPSKVLTKNSLNSFVSSIYTLVDGVYARNKDDDVEALTNIGTISLGDDSYTVGACGNSLTSEYVQAIDLDYRTICGISGIDYEMTEEYPMWMTNRTTDFHDKVMAAFKKYSGKEMELKNTMEVTPASVIRSYNENANIIVVTFGKEKIERYTGTIITYMNDLPHTES